LDWKNATPSADATQKSKAASSRSTPNSRLQLWNAVA